MIQKEGRESTVYPPIEHRDDDGLASSIDSLTVPCWPSWLLWTDQSPTVAYRVSPWRIFLSLAAQYYSRHPCGIYLYRSARCPQVPAHRRAFCVRVSILARLHPGADPRL